MTHKSSQGPAREETPPGTVRAGLDRARLLLSEFRTYVPCDCLQCEEMKEKVAEFMRETTTLELSKEIAAVNEQDTGGNSTLTRLRAEVTFNKDALAFAQVTDASLMHSDLRKLLALAEADAGAQSRTPTNLESRTVAPQPETGNLWLCYHALKSSEWSYINNSEIGSLSESWCLAGKPSFQPSLDTDEWIEHKMTDPSWEEWRRELPSPPVASQPAKEED